MKAKGNEKGGKNQISERGRQESERNERRGKGQS